MFKCGPALLLNRVETTKVAVVHANLHLSGDVFNSLGARFVLPLFSLLPFISLLFLFIALLLSLSRHFQLGFLLLIYSFRQNVVDDVLCGFEGAVYPAANEMGGARIGHGFGSGVETVGRSRVVLGAFVPFVHRAPCA